MQIKNNILRHYLRNCYFMTGTAYAGKSTMCAMLAERFGLLHCGENWGLDDFRAIATQEDQPATGYFSRMGSWQAFVLRTPDEYEQWIDGSAWERADFEAAELIRISADRKVIVDTNIPVELLREISDYDHVAVMLSPQSMSVERFFDRGDEEKQFLLRVIESCPDPDAALANFRACIARVNSPERYRALAESGLFTVVRQPEDGDTREATLTALARHFGFMA